MNSPSTPKARNILRDFKEANFLLDLLGKKIKARSKSNNKTIEQTTIFYLEFKTSVQEVPFHTKHPVFDENRKSKIHENYRRLLSVVDDLCWSIFQ
jgi:hypothetical protein